MSSCWTSRLCGREGGASSAWQVEPLGATSSRALSAAGRRLVTDLIAEPSLPRGTHRGRDSGLGGPVPEPVRAEHGEQGRWDASSSHEVEPVWGVVVVPLVILVLTLVLEAIEADLDRPARSALSGRRAQPRGVSGWGHDQP